MKIINYICDLFKKTKVNDLKSSDYLICTYQEYLDNLELFEWCLKNDPDRIEKSINLIIEKEKKDKNFNTWFCGSVIKNIYATRPDFIELLKPFFDKLKSDDIQDILTVYVNSHVYYMDKTMLYKSLKPYFYKLSSFKLVYIVSEKPKVFDYLLPYFYKVSLHDLYWLINKRPFEWNYRAAGGWKEKYKNHLYKVYG